MLTGDRFIVYGGTAHHGFDAEVLRLINSVTGLGLEFSHCWYNIWPDGEPGFRLEDPATVSGRHALVFACPITDKYENNLKDLITACKRQYGAASVTAILSFMRYRRQDRSEHEHEITRLRWFISDLKHWGADRFVVCEPHSVENTRRYCQESGLELHISDPTRLFADTVNPVIQTLGGADRVSIYSPDMGSVGRAISLAKAIGARVLATPKRRVNGRIEMVNSNDFIELVRARCRSDVPISCDLDSIRGSHIFMREDEIDSGTSAATTAKRLREAGAESVSFIATHPVCSRGWKMKLFPYREDAPFKMIWLGNTRPRGDGETEYEGSTGSKIIKVDMAPVIAEILIKVLAEIKD